MNIRKKENYRPKGKDKKKKKIQRKKIAKKWNTFRITSDPIRFIRKLIKTWLKAAAKRAMLFENHWIVKIVIVSIVKIVIVSENADRFTDWTKC